MIASSHVNADALTVADVISAYKRLAFNRLAPASRSSREPIFDSLVARLGTRPVSECKPVELLLWLDSNPKWVSDWTKNSAIKYIQTAFNWAVDVAEIIDRNPFKRIFHPQGLPRRDIKPEEFQAVMRATAGRRSRRRNSAAPRIRQVLIFLRYTGCRPCEAADLKWEWVNLDRRVIFLPRHKTHRTQRQPMPRVIHLHSVVVKLLRWIAAREKGVYVFTNYRKTKWTRHTLSQRVTRAREKAGLPDDVKLYGLRHAFGTRAIMNGCDIKTLAQLMGHTSTRMTEKYVHLAGESEHLSAALEVVNKPRFSV